MSKWRAWIAVILAAAVVAAGVASLLRDRPVPEPTSGRVIGFSFSGSYPMGCKLRIVPAYGTPASSSVLVNPNDPEECLALRYGDRWSRGSVSVPGRSPAS